MKENNKTFEEVFTFSNLLNAGIDCQRGVRWKTSVQSYAAKILVNTYNTQQELFNGTFQYKSKLEFDLYERGKARHIKSMNIKERVPQKALCDNYILEIIEPLLIYDNGASLKGKGLDFTLNRLKAMLQKYYRKNGNVGYALIFDYKNYFGSINHRIAIELMSKYVKDTRILDFIKQSLQIYADVKNESGDYVGIGLGSQLSQIFALLMGNPVDHMIKDKYRFKYYIRYMDDGIIIHNDKEKLKEILELIKIESAKIGLTLNENKTHIVRIDKGFTFLKKKIVLNPNGSILVRLSKQSITRERRKLKKFKKKYEDGKMPLSHIENSYKSWRGFALRFNSYNSVQNMDSLYKELFGYVPRYPKKSKKSKNKKNKGKEGNNKCSTK